MKKNYEALSKQIIANVGGVNNVNSLYHCVTRLRFKLKDDSKANKKALEQMEGVLSVVEGNGQYQVVIGNAVSDVYETIMKMYAIKGEQQTGASHEPSTGNVLTRLFNTMSSIFNPIIIALAGAGMIKALLVILTTYVLLENTTSTFKILSAAGNSVFYFLPLFLAVSAAKTFGVNPYISLAIVAALIEPNFMGLIENTGDVVSFIGIPVVLMKYTGTVIPAILAIYVYSKLERQLKKVIPKSIELFALSLVSLLIMVPLTVMVIGPIGVTLGNGLGDLINFVSNKSGLLAGLIIGAGWTYLVIMGIHWGVVPIMVNNLANYGYDVIRPMIAAATFASAGVAFGVFLRSKKKANKAFALSSMVPALLGGITEPIVYGLSIKYRKPLIAQTIAGGIAGAFMAAMKTKAIVYVFPALTTLPAFFGDTFGYYCIGIFMAFSISAALTYILGFDENEASEGEALEKEDLMLSMSACINGEMIPLEQVNDPVFSSKGMGDGVAFIPNEGILYSPVDAVVEMIFPTLHAIGLKTSSGAEILMHIGINTVDLKGEGFATTLKQGDPVKRGQVLIEFDLKKIMGKGYDPTTVLCVTNMDKVQKIEPIIQEHITKNDTVLNVVMEGA
ncbi:beta-glucoside-specific PTS transporter subunit IIABC [Fusibacter ferrireducens]|uniref:beta-glucoside-specific PTS transporter subunit IIABC n=1 Tax=Fusibacter ferrireducens TaxID=2785058 RepID=UPI001E62C8CB|nr:beta-glucoside-specific PTS transporter subunit IIABC [Fusibacter ferrireducens]